MKDGVKVDENVVTELTVRCRAEAGPGIELGEDSRNRIVKELKRRIVALGAETQDCVEKADLVRRYEERRRRPGTRSCSWDFGYIQPSRS